MSVEIALWVPGTSAACMGEVSSHGTIPFPGHVTRDPGILGGKPFIAGTRISVQLILEKLRDGWTIDALLDDYPQLTREQVVAALAYAAEVLGTPATP